LITKPYSIVIAGFDSPVQVIDNIMTSTEQTPTQTIVTTVIRFKLQLFEVEVVTPSVSFDYSFDFNIQ
jgi:hypothetical protein